MFKRKRYVRPKNVDNYYMIVVEGNIFAAEKIMLLTQNNDTQSVDGRYYVCNCC